MNTISNTDLTKERIRKSLVYSIYDGIAFSVMFGMSDSFFQAFGIYLGAGSLELGLLKTLPLTLGALSQLATGFILSKFRSRRRFISLSTLLQALMFLPIMFSYFLGPLRVGALIVFLCLSAFFFMVPMPAWLSWMGDLVEEKTRGGYLGRRASITGVITFPSLLLAGVILEQARQAGMEYIGFAAIFAIALFGRMVSSYFLGKKYDPPYDYSAVKSVKLKDVLAHLKHTSAGVLIVFLCALNFAFMIVTPYIDIYLLRDLRLDYISFTMVNAVILAVKYLFTPFWGRACDRYGTRKVLVVSSALVSIVPFMWMFGNNLPVIILIQVFAGFSWAAFELSTFNYLLNATTPRDRTASSAFYNVTNGIVGLLGSFAGGIIIAIAQLFTPSQSVLDNIINTALAIPKPLFWTPYLFIFPVSGVLRFLLVALFASRLKEPRRVEHIRAHLLPLRVISMMTNRGIVLGLDIFQRIRKNSGGGKGTTKKIKPGLKPDSKTG